MSPNRPMPNCTFPGCGNRARGRCAEHAAPMTPHVIARHGASRRYGRLWRKRRGEYLRMPANRLCRACGNAFATEIDHIVPVIGDSDPNFWNETNWQGLCKSCHSRKTRTAQNQKRGNA